MLAAASAYFGVLRPRLRADTDGVTIRSLRGPRHWTWSELTVRVVHSRRLGRTVGSLELDTADGELLVLTRTDLGADPEDVADALHALRP